MIVKGYILTTLKELDKLYNTTKSSKKATYFSKLALLELCGWIEESFDSIVLSYAKKLRLQENKKYYEDKIVRNNSGFVYKSHLRPMMISLIGLIETEKIEKKITRNKKGNFHFEIFKSSLGDLKTLRNKAAHTHIGKITPSYDSPSKIFDYFKKVYPILKMINKEFHSR